MIILRALGALLTYPRPDLLTALSEIGDVIVKSPLVDRERRGQLQALIGELSHTDLLELEQRYVALFDTGRSTCLWLFEHVHGESRERGQAMVDLREIYQRAGFQLAANELPDYLPAVLEYLSYREPPEAHAMLGDCAHILRKIGSRLAAQGSRYATVFDALLRIAAQPALDPSAAMAAEPPSAPERSLDEEWTEAPAFGPGSARTEPTVEPLRYMPRGRREDGAQP
jgi:nitrate reductase molybdenum cofactor assembly chaperone NarJ/NarW